MSDQKRSSDIEEILADFKRNRQSKESADNMQDSGSAPDSDIISTPPASEQNPPPAPEPEPQPTPTGSDFTQASEQPTSEPTPPPAPEPEPQPTPTGSDSQPPPEPPAPATSNTPDTGTVQPTPEPEPRQENNQQSHLDRNVVLIGDKTLNTYTNATLTQLSSHDVVTIKARGKKITHAVDVAQLLIKRMNAIGYIISDIRIYSDYLMSKDGKKRPVSSIEIDISVK